MVFRIFVLNEVSILPLFSAERTIVMVAGAGFDQCRSTVKSRTVQWDVWGKLIRVDHSSGKNVCCNETVHECFSGTVWNTEE